MASQKPNMNEIYFRWWVEELQKIGIVKSFEEQPEKFVLEDALPVFYKQVYKRKEPIIKSFNLFNPITYTCDYKVVFDKTLLNKLFGVIDSKLSYLNDDENIQAGNVYQNTLFYLTDKQIDENGNYVIYFDVKPPASAVKFSASLGSSRDFKFNQRMTYSVHNVYVNKVVPNEGRDCLYNKTFVPNRYLFTDSTMKLRKRKDHLKYITIDKYLQT